LRASHSPLSIIILNSSNDFVQWLERIRLASLESQFGLKPEQYEQIISLLEYPAKYGGGELLKLKQYLKGWDQMKDLPPELKINEVGELTEEMFQVNLKKWRAV